MAKSALKDGYYWFTSERSSFRSVGQLVQGRWYLVDEVGPVSLQEINRRGWDLGKRIKGQNKP